jgi:hypothetical protein
MVAVQATQGFDVYAAKYDSQEGGWFQLQIGGFAREVFPNGGSPFQSRPANNYKDGLNMNSSAMHHTPTIAERFWRRLGFNYVRNDLPENIEATHPGWMITNANFRFNWGDRIRLLFSGRLDVEIRQATTQQIDESVNAVSHHIKPPF